MNIHDFDDIRPYLPEELPAIYDKLLRDPEFQGALAYVFKGIPLEQIAARIRACRSNLELQINIVYPMLKQLVADAANGLTSNLAEAQLDPHVSHTFISNHRDIVLDSALLSVALHDAGSNTVEIAIGDNLLIRPWIRDFVRANKSFIVQRSLPLRQMLLASAKMSRYMHFAISEKRENIWIAQREGRAKDSDDRTQESVLKMLAMGGDLRELNIVPLTISYELDPCDYLKAQEFQNKRDIAGFKKSPQDDLDNMRIGIFGPKGHIDFHAAPCINDWLDTLPPDLPKTEYFRRVAEHIDREIHRNYRLYPANYIAADRLSGSPLHADRYTAEQAAQFDAYVQQKLSLVQLAQPDVPYLTERILTMYANPLLNYEKAIRS